MSNKQSKQSKQSDKEVTRKHIKTADNAKVLLDISRLSAFRDSIAHLKAEQVLAATKNEQQRFVVAVALALDKLRERSFTFEQFAHIVNASEKCKALNLTSYVYNERELDRVLKQRAESKAICADRVCQRDRVDLAHTEKMKTANTHRVLKIDDAKLDRSKHESDNKARARDVLHSINSNAIEILESIAKICSK